MSKHLIFIIFFQLVTVRVCLSQYMPEGTGNEAIYTFLDELASQKLIDPLPVVKPYNKYFVYQLLQKSYNANKNGGNNLITGRQEKELEFYLKAYAFECGNKQTLDSIGYADNPKVKVLKNTVALGYRDSLFRITIRPLAQGVLNINNSATVQNRWWGASIAGQVGSSFSFYTSLTDHWETESLALNTYLTPIQGGKYKNAVGRTGGEYSDLTGGINYGWRWGHVGFIYDRLLWGSGYHGTNLFSGRTPPFPQLTFSMKPARWFEFNYVHAWLSSDIVDSTRSYTSGYGFKTVYYEKYLAANMFTFIPWKTFRFSVGNSIIYAGPKAYPGFIIPTLFFRSVDENYAYINNNSQMFFDASYRPVKHVHVYGSLYVDDFRISRITSKKNYNLHSFKWGTRVNNWPFNNVAITAEFTATTPITYKHKLDVLTFASNKYSLGNYLRDNSREAFAEISWKPYRGTALYVQYIDARHGNEYQYITDEAAVSYPQMKDIIWKNNSVKAGIIFEIYKGSYLKGSVMYSRISSTGADGISAQQYLDMFTPTFLQGNKLTLEGGFVLGL